MSVSRQLQDMLTDLRAEIGHSTNVAHGINDRDTLIYYLNRTQIRLYQDYDWPLLTVSRDVTVSPGQRYYPYPTDMAFPDINNIVLFAPQPLLELAYGIGPAQMSFSNSVQNQQNWPPRRWMHSQDMAMFELWPIPDATAGKITTTVQLWGTRTVTNMVNDSDTATLPDNLIVLFCAAELLARDGAKDASMKLQQANEAMRRHRVRQNKGQPFVMGGGGGDTSTYGGTACSPVLGLDYIPPYYGSGPG